jgi:hypothetical protein
MYDAVIIVGGVAVFAMAIAAVGCLVYPYYKRKQALHVKPGMGSATPIRRQAKTNPDYTREDRYSDIMSEENEFLKGRI